MAKKKSLKERIDALVNALGAAEKPSSAQIRNELVALALDVEALENGKALAEKDARISDLEAALEKSDVELGNLKVLLEEAGGELATFRVEQKKREEKEREINPTQLKILQRLGSPASCEWLNIDEIARALKIPVDEAEIYVEGLEKKLGLIFFHPHEPGGGGWLRTAEGNKLVVAKRWAGEEQEQNTHKYVDLPEIEHRLLTCITGFDDGIDESSLACFLGKTVELVRFTLRKLEKAEMATDGDEPDYGTGRRWYLLEKGNEYLAERGLL